VGLGSWSYTSCSDLGIVRHEEGREPWEGAGAGLGGLGAGSGAGGAAGVIRADPGLGWAPGHGCLPTPGKSRASPSPPSPGRLAHPWVAPVPEILRGDEALGPPGSLAAGGTGGTGVVPMACSWGGHTIQVPLSGGWVQLSLLPPHARGVPWGPGCQVCSSDTPSSAKNLPVAGLGGGCLVAMAMRMMLAAPWEAGDLPGNGGGRRSVSLRSRGMLRRDTAPSGTSLEPSGDALRGVQLSVVPPNPRATRARCRTSAYWFPACETSEKSLAASLLPGERTIPGRP